MQLPDRFKTYTVKNLTAMGLGDRATIYRAMANGRFPLFFKRGEKTLWLVDDITKHLNKEKATP